MNILQIDCSPRRESHSRLLSAAIVARLARLARSVVIRRRDLGLAPIPHAAPDYATVLAAPAIRTAGAPDALQLSEKLIREVETADILVIGTPMNNFTVPSVLKAWIDQILRVGRTIASTPNGKVGMLRDRPVFVGIAAGSVFSGDRAREPDFLTPYLGAALGCVGLTSVHFLPLQGTAFIDDARAAAARSALVARIGESDLFAAPVPASMRDPGVRPRPRVVPFVLPRRRPVAPPRAEAPRVLVLPQDE
jgi:FMN-dependent NADH-azoreductase